MKMSSHTHAYTPHRVVAWRVFLMTYAAMLLTSALFASPLLAAHPDFATTTPTTFLNTFITSPPCWGMGQLPLSLMALTGCTPSVTGASHSNILNLPKIPPRHVVAVLPPFDLTMTTRGLRVDYA